MRALQPEWMVVPLTVLALLVPSGRVVAHCDTLDGPVVAAARAALDAGSLQPLLPWVKPESEAELGEAFQSALAVRSLGDRARALADRYFLETAVRLHRTGEGVAYTGIKPSGTPVDPAIRLADLALETGSAAELKQVLGGAVQEGVETRFQEALERKAHTGHGVEAGRAFVEAYVAFTHYVERLHQDATHGASHGGEGAEEAHQHP